MEYVVETEKEIVQNYIIKSKQERIEWELSHSKKRKDIIWHFHKPDIFKEACLHAVDYMDKEAMKNYLHKLNGAENVYFIGEDYIGEMLLEQAAERPAPLSNIKFTSTKYSYSFRANSRIIVVLPICLAPITHNAFFLFSFFHEYKRSDISLLSIKSPLIQVL